MKVLYVLSGRALVPHDNQCVLCQINKNNIESFSALNNDHVINKGWKLN